MQAEAVEFGSGTNFGGKPVSVALMSSNTEELKSAKDYLKSEFRKNPLLKDITDNDPEGIKEINITLKESAYAMGFTLNSVISQIRSGFFGYQVQRFQRGQDEIKVWVRYDLNERSSLQNLDDMRLVECFRRSSSLARSGQLYLLKEGDFDQSPGWKKRNSG